jgi:hypothetical protein
MTETEDRARRISWHSNGRPTRRQQPPNRETRLADEMSPRARSSSRGCSSMRRDSSSLTRSRRGSSAACTRPRGFASGSIGRAWASVRRCGSMTRSSISGGTYALTQFLPRGRLPRSPRREPAASGRGGSSGGRGRDGSQPRRNSLPTAAIISSVRSSCWSGSAPITQVCA